jgi:uncharacterized protein
LGAKESLNAPRVVFDTNVVVSALVFGKRLGWLRSCWAQSVATPLICRETIDELLRVFSYPKFKLSAEESSALLEDYLPFAEIVSLSKSARTRIPAACRDRKDVIFLQLAVASKADFLVSGDADIKVLRSHLTVPVVTVAEFMTHISTLKR